jgi:hypothetical protein
MEWITKKSWFDCRQRQDIFVSSEASRSTLVIFSVLFFTDKANVKRTELEEEQSPSCNAEIVFLNKYYRRDKENGMGGTCSTNGMRSRAYCVLMGKRESEIPV